MLLDSLPDVRRWGFAAALFLLSAALAGQSPAEPWRTIRTEHFRVHYPAPYEKWAARAAASIEGIHARVTELVGYRPSRPIDVLIEDPAAEANGSAFPFLDRPYIVLWTSPPEAESDIGDYSGWMELLVTHEMAHIVHLVRPQNRPGVLSRLLRLPLGPVVLKSPRWVIEGYATVVEGALTGSGRPRSSYRAMILRRFAIEGKLPSYRALSGTGGFLGGSMAYLVGSAYLEWLEQKEGEGSLVRLWKRLASRRGGDFESAFRAIFGRSPADLYDRFRAELTEAAIAEEKRLTAAGLVEGELWQRLEGGTVAPQVSPDGTKILARRDRRRGRSALAVWTIEETAEEKAAVERARRREAKLLEDVNEAPEKEVLPRPRSPKWVLPRINGYSASSPRWMPDGRRILFSRRSPDAEGDLRWDLYLWDFESGDVSRVTHGEDLPEADPSADGKWAAAVRSRYGMTEVVKVDLASGAVAAIPGFAMPDPAIVWTHPRISPDGRSVAAIVHREARWRLVVASGGKEPVEIRLPLSGHPVGPPAWNPDAKRIYAATDAQGIWNVVSAETSGAAASEPAVLTRVTGGAFSPAPSPDGRSLFFLELTAKGVDLRRLSLPSPPAAPLGMPSEVSAVLPPPPLTTPPAPFATAQAGPSTPYRVGETHLLRVSSGFTVGPDGASYQTGVEGSDLVGRLRWSALGAAGNAAGPRGGSAAGAWLGFPVELRLQIFSALEKPGSQRLVPRPELDEERRGAFAAASWGRPFSWGAVRFEGGGGWTRVEPISGGEDFDRALGTMQGKLRFRHTRGDSGFAADVEAWGAFGSTDGQSWSQGAGSGRLTWINAPANLSFAARYGTTGGSPTRFDVFALGGAGSAILPPGLDRNRIESPALPAAVQLGDRFEAYRAELTPSFFPFVVYAERMRAWNSGAARPDWVRLEGIEARFERLVPPDILGPFSFYAGVARVRCYEPRFDSIRGYGGLILRP